MDAWRLANCTIETHLDGSDIHVGFHSFHPNLGHISGKQSISSSHPHIHPRPFCQPKGFPTQKGWESATVSIMPLCSEPAQLQSYHELSSCCLPFTSLLFVLVLLLFLGPFLHFRMFGLLKFREVFRRTKPKGVLGRRKRI